MRGVRPFSSQYIKINKIICITEKNPEFSWISMANTPLFKRCLAWRETRLGAANECLNPSLRRISLARSIIFRNMLNSQLFGLFI